jgi:prepilin-type N-terminal cleavage/methylation domain-containing protein
MLIMNRSGFTMIELVVAVVILALGVLGLGASAGRLSTTAVSVEQQALALQAATDRVSLIVLHPNYPELGSLFTGTESDIPELPGFTRVTQITRVQQPGTGGRIVDYTLISVTVHSPHLGEPLIQTAVVAPQ